MMSTGKVITVAELKESLKSKLRAWEYIIIHHSQTRDKKILSDFEAIKNYHMSYRLNGDVITKEQADSLVAQGKTVIVPWKDIAYHYVIEYKDDKLVLREARDMDTSGAHCSGMNGKAIGICIVGDYDVTEPVDEQINLLSDTCLALMTAYNIPVEKIKPHHFYAPWKSCPGNKFPWMKFAKNIIDKNYLA